MVGQNRTRLKESKGKGTLRNTKEKQAEADLLILMELFVRRSRRVRMSTEINDIK